ncbi:hypothetical protein ACFY0R_39775 [Streptomyces sp. NPDC001633]|uniref:hypothetical protein n=1 Tax=Streptomyces sp. NPDC001633 TaxID=3364595 RepID=UPI0036BC4301
MTDEIFARRLELMRLPKATLVRMVREFWVAGEPPERWTKEELAAEVADMEESQERYRAYGQVTLINQMPASGTRPHCGGTGCTGHDAAPPWPATRDRYRAKAPCIDRADGGEGQGT